LLQFTKLRLTGFKSFVDPTELLIERGLTGVVGPNGCGKSNVVEALRWVMGETSAKQMRGGEMDDVIFGGTASRPARNLAEVILKLDNDARTAPAQFNDVDELEVSRRIERGVGSIYRVNGKEVRARDVQLLFADAATGARSPALVSQGRVGAVIAAKPIERRSLLEEAAGIIGLHSRRHEAELRLRAAESNLARLDDILVTLEAQLQNLKKQSRQTARYRNLSEHIRTAEATLFLLKWRQAEAELEVSRARLREAEDKVAELTRYASVAATAQAECAAELPALRHAEAAAAAELQRLVLARETLEAEERRLESQRQDCATRLQQIAQDMSREEALAADAAAAIGVLDAERADLEGACAGEEAEQTEAQNRAAAASAAVEALDAELAQLTQQVADLEARRAALQRTLAEIADRRQRLTARAAEIRDQHADAESQAIAGATLDAADAALAQARAAHDAARAEVEAAERTRAEAAERAAQALAKRHEAEAALARLEAEENALAALLETGAPELWPPLIDAVGVEPGFEAALGVALGEDLSAPADDAAPVHWRTLPPYPAPPPLPVSVPPLSRFVRAPEALSRRLSQIGVVADDAEGHALCDQLQQGQRLVSREGALWRWDGYTVSAGAITAAAARLEQRNRLKDVRARLADARADAERTRAAANAARGDEAQASESEKLARARVQACDDVLLHTRDALADLKSRAAEHDSKLAALAATARSVDADLAEASALANQAEGELVGLADPAAARERLAELRAELGRCRAVQLECQSAYDNLKRAAEGRRHRLDDIRRELESWRQRAASAESQQHALTERRTAVEDELRRIADRPAEIAAQRQALLATIETAEAKRQEAADRLAEMEAQLQEADRALRAAEAELASAREERVRAEGLVTQAQQAGQGIAERIAERLDCAPPQLAQIAKLKDDEPPPDIEAVERKVERLHRERETMGPVNLRAEQEAQELNQQMESMQTERADLIKAIEKLRQGIAELNREGRERLLKSFHDVDKHFQQLFVRLFGGGRAHLALVESDDPLEAGLEIMASPPGKRLQVLSLLSGGEQALTALALLFGVFLTNPAPICVLDEVDAPLDDANVDRFCTLLEEMAQSSGTRFLVITHHRMTMARMDRLFGVTMQERGISQLVSVDLQRAEELRATA